MTAYRWTPAHARCALLLACGAAALAALAIPIPHVLAGAKSQTEGVSINTFLRTADGSLGATRAGGTSSDYIGCWSRRNVPLGVQTANDGDIEGGCEARQRVGLITQTASCTFLTAANVTVGFQWVLQAMTTDSHIHFSWVSIGGRNICQQVKISNFSHSRPTT
jgi:hypothetical protein